MRKSAPEPISAVLQNVVKKLDRVKKQDIVRIRAWWSAAVGNDLARHCRPAALKKGTLMVNVNASAWMYQINLQRGKIIAKLQEKFGAEKVKEIHLRIGQIRNR